MKADAIQKVRAQLGLGLDVRMACSKVASESGELKKRNVRRWWNNREAVEELALHDRHWKKRFYSSTEERRPFEEEEEALYLLFLDRRMNEGYPVDGAWLQHAMSLLVQLNKPNQSAEKQAKAARFGASPGWLDRFKKKYNIRSLARTNAHAQPIAQR